MTCRRKSLRARHNIPGVIAERFVRRGWLRLRWPFNFYVHCCHRSTPAPGFFRRSDENQLCKRYPTAVSMQLALLAAREYVTTATLLGTSGIQPDPSACARTHLRAFPLALDSGICRRCRWFSRDYGALIVESSLVEFLPPLRLFEPNRLPATKPGVATHALSGGPRR